MVVWNVVWIAQCVVSVVLRDLSDSLLEALS